MTLFAAPKEIGALRRASRGTPLSSSLTREISHAEAVNGSGGGTSGLGLSNGHHAHSSGSARSERRGLDAITHSKVCQPACYKSPRVSPELSIELNLLFGRYS